MFLSVFRPNCSKMSRALGFAKVWVKRVSSGSESSATKAIVQDSRSHSNSYFTSGQIEHFNTKGYVVASPDFLVEDEKMDIVGWATELSTWKQTCGKKTILKYWIDLFYFEISS